MQTKNEIFEILAKAITIRIGYRCIIDFENGDTMLVDFSDCGDSFEDDTVCVWSLQRDMDEIDSGSFKDYADVYNFVVETLSNNNGEIYVSRF